MAGSPGTTTATVLGGFWETMAVASLTQVGRGPWRRRVAQALGKKATGALRELMLTLDGATAGSAASEVRTRVANSTELGGVRTIENETLVSANTHADDATRINAQVLALSSKTYTSSPVVNGDGNPLGTR